jgi:hypothetical protein
MKTITAKFNSKCAATGADIKKGEVINYDPILKKVYKIGNEPQTKNYQNPDAWIEDYLIESYYK